MSKEYKLGETVTMLFKGAGVVSEEEYEIMEVSEDTITLDNEYTFSTFNGDCLNDNTTLGFRRSLKLPS